MAFSPRMRGCFRLIVLLVKRLKVFPAYAGMFLLESLYGEFNLCFPRVCGDVSIISTTRENQGMFSPRMRGCFNHCFVCCRAAWVFPAYAGMFLRQRRSPILPLGFPRVCGDVSASQFSSFQLLEFSPRMRGCFFSI